MTTRRSTKRSVSPTAEVGRRSDWRREPENGETFLSTLPAALHADGYARFLEAPDLLRLTCTCRSAARQWLPEDHLVWWKALLRLSDLPSETEGGGADDEAVEFPAAAGSPKRALLRLGPLVLYRQEGVFREGGMESVERYRLPPPEKVLGFVFVPAAEKTISIVEPSFRFFSGNPHVPGEQGRVLFDGGVWCVNNVEPGLWLVTLRKEKEKVFEQGGPVARVAGFRAYVYLNAFHENVLQVELGSWHGHARKVLQALPWDPVEVPQNCARLIVGKPRRANFTNGRLSSLVTETKRPPAFYAKKYYFRPTALSLSEQSQLWFEQVAAGRCRRIHGFHLQLGGASDADLRAMQRQGDGV